MKEGGVVYDLYCGTGSFGLAAAKHSKVHTDASIHIYIYIYVYMYIYIYMYI